MYYRPGIDQHGLPHNPFNAIVAPRPIGWIGTRGADGRENLAPYSFFNAVAYTPPQVIFSSTGVKPDRGDTKDSVSHIRETGVFSVNLVNEALLHQMNATSGAYPAETDEFTLADLERAPCREIACSCVAASPAVLECECTEIVPLRGRSNFLVIGEVKGIHIRDEFIRDGRYDVSVVKPLSRLGYRDYTVVREVFELARPGEE